MRKWISLVEQRAFHGSPHNFQAFTTDKLGTGNGMSSYGWGLYFSDSVADAEKFAKMVPNQGVIYTVEIPNGPYFDLNKSLNEQPPEVQAAFAEFPTPKHLGWNEGEDYLHALQVQLGSKKAASMHLHHHGVVGTTYSGGFGVSGRGFVVFDHHQVKITAKTPVN